MVNKKILLVLSLFVGLVIVASIIYGIVQLFNLKNLTIDQSVQTSKTSHNTTSNIEITGYDKTRSLLPADKATIEKVVRYQLQTSGLVGETDKIKAEITLTSGTDASPVQVYVVKTEKANFQITYDRNQSKAFRVQIACQGSDGIYEEHYCVQD